MAEDETVKKEDDHDLIGCEYEIEVIDKDGNVTERQKGKNSLLIQFIGSIISALDPNGYNTICPSTDVKNVAGGAASNMLYQYNSNTYCGIPSAGTFGVITNGIVVGSGNTPVTADDYKLATIITHGVGAGQLQAQAGAIQDVVLASPRASFRIDRTFINGSGAPVTVREIGIYSLWYDGGVGSQICTCRDVLLAPVAVANGSTLFVKYTIYISI